MDADFEIGGEYDAPSSSGMLLVVVMAVAAAVVALVWWVSTRDSDEDPDDDDDEDFDEDLVRLSEQDSQAFSAEITEFVPSYSVARNTLTIRHAIDSQRYPVIVLLNGTDYARQVDDNGMIEMDLTPRPGAGEHQFALTVQTLSGHFLVQSTFTLEVITDPVSFKHVTSDDENIRIEFTAPAFFSDSNVTHLVLSEDSAIANIDQMVLVSVPGEFEFVVPRVEVVGDVGGTLTRDPFFEATEAADEHRFHERVTLEWDNSSFGLQIRHAMFLDTWQGTSNLYAGQVEMHLWIAHPEAHDEDAYSLTVTNLEGKVVLENELFDWSASGLTTDHLRDIYPDVNIPSEYTGTELKSIRYFIPLGQGDVFSDTISVEMRTKGTDRLLRRHDATFTHHAVHCDLIGSGTQLNLDGFKYYETPDQNFWKVPAIWSFAENLAQMTREGFLHNAVLEKIEYRVHESQVDPDKALQSFQAHAWTDPTNFEDNIDRMSMGSYFHESDYVLNPGFVPELTQTPYSITHSSIAGGTTTRCETTLTKTHPTRVPWYDRLADTRSLAIVWPSTAEINLVAGEWYLTVRADFPGHVYENESGYHVLGSSYNWRLFRFEYKDEYNGNQSPLDIYLNAADQSEGIAFDQFSQMPSDEQRFPPFSDHMLDEEAFGNLIDHRTVEQPEISSCDSDVTCIG